MKRILMLSLLGLAGHIAADLQQVDKNRFFDFDYIASLFFENVISPTDIAKKLIKDVYSVQPPHHPVHVHTDTNLSSEERNFLRNRTHKVRRVLEKHFGIDEPLRIGICCSGGGNRAMVGSLGFLLGAAKTNILDATTYLSGLSGSTWLIAPFSYLAATTYKYEQFEDILRAIKDDFIKRLNDFSMININGIHTPPLLSFDSTDDVLVETAKRFAYEQPVTLVNLFGSLVGDYALGLMGCDRLTTFWTDIASEIQLGDTPLPLCSAIFDTSFCSHNDYEWFEMSPLQAGSSMLGYIPVQYLGSQFSFGTLDDSNICPEYPLSFYLGMYGSGFAITVHDIGTIQKSLGEPTTILKDAQLRNIQRGHYLLENNIVLELAKSIVHSVISSRNPLTFAHFPNYSQGLFSSLLRDQPNLGLFDAGIDMDLPVPAFVDREERSVDVILLYDAHQGNTTTLHKISDYCHRKGVAFPDVSQVEDSVRHNVMTVLNDPRSWGYNPRMTTYIYIPTNDFDTTLPPYATLNFRYEEQDVNVLSNNIENIVISQADEIKEVMKLVATRKAHE